MEYDKENLEKLFHYGSKILDELENSAHEKSAALQNLNNRYKNLRENLQSLLNNSDIEEGRN